MSITSRRFISIGLGAAIALAVASPGPAIAAKARPDRPAVRAEATLEISGAWAGRISLGTHTSGRVRTARPLPLDMHLTRTSCDVVGCWTTEVVVAPASGVPLASRIAGKLRSASVKPTTVAVTVRRSVHGRVVAEYPATLSLSVSVRSSGPLTRRTTLTQSPGAEVLTVSRSTPVVGTAVIGGETLAVNGEISRTRIVQ